MPSRFKRALASSRFSRSLCLAFCLASLALSASSLAAATSALVRRRCLTPLFALPTFLACARLAWCLLGAGGLRLRSNAFAAALSWRLAPESA
jgi:hypothetical protein